MDFRSIMNQITRPYWSPMHPRSYLTTRNGMVIGWGRLFPEEIGAFNLMWLVSGVGGPPEDYNRYMPAVQRVSAYFHVPIRGQKLADLAALNSIDEFASIMNSSVYMPQLDFLYAALRLRV